MFGGDVFTSGRGPPSRLQPERSCTMVVCDRVDLLQRLLKHVRNTVMACATSLSSRRLDALLSPSQLTLKMSGTTVVRHHVTSDSAHYCLEPKQKRQMRMITRDESGQVQRTRNYNADRRAENKRERNTRHDSRDSSPVCKDLEHHQIITQAT